MALLDIPLDRITEADVRRLMAAGAAESLYIDYKQATYGGKEADDHAELLADVSSFANTAGGDLVIGVAETGGVPNAILPFTGNADDERRRIEDIARTGVEPRVRNLQTRAVPLAEGGAVIIVRVPRSYAPPHRVIYKNRRSRFWARASLANTNPTSRSCATSSLRRLESPSASPPFEPIVSSGLRRARHRSLSGPAARSCFISCQYRHSPTADCWTWCRLSRRARMSLYRSTAWGRKSPRHQYRRLSELCGSPCRRPAKLRAVLSVWGHRGRREPQQTRCRWESLFRGPRVHEQSSSRCPAISQRAGGVRCWASRLCLSIAVRCRPMLLSL